MTNAGKCGIPQTATNAESAIDPAADRAPPAAACPAAAPTHQTGKTQSPQVACGASSADAARRSAAEPLQTESYERCSSFSVKPVVRSRGSVRSAAWKSKTRCATTANRAVLAIAGRVER